MLAVIWVFRHSLFIQKVRYCLQEGLQMGQIKKKNRGLHHHLGEHRTDDVVFLEQTVRAEVHRVLRELRPGRVHHHKFS